MQQLSLPLNLPNTSANEVTWFQHILDVLGVSRGAGWCDKFGLSLRQWLMQHGHTPIKTLSLFSGGGGLDIAFHDAGFDIVQMVEVEAKYVQTLRQNSMPGKWLENSKAICVDIREYFPHTELEVDFIIGGPPCQSFSAAGRRAAGVSGTKDARGILFQEYVRLLKTLKPKGFLFENVYGITGARNGKDWQKIQNAFKEAGYTIYFRTWGNDKWSLGTNKVMLSANDLNQHLFIAVWKFFEEKLLEVTGMADLVQLSGYYQYNPRISGVMTFHQELKVNLFWRVVQCVVRGIGVAIQLSAQGLASLWGVEAENVFSYLQDLRSMGYEVRNHNTNPQIPKGEYLIPYAFPTLTPRSVQLRKNLGTTDE